MLSTLASLSGYPMLGVRNMRRCRVCSSIRSRRGVWVKVLLYFLHLVILYSFCVQVKRSNLEQPTYLPHRENTLRHTPEKAQCFEPVKIAPV